MTIRKYSKTTNDDLFVSKIQDAINPDDTVNSFDHGELDAVSIDFTDVSGNAEIDIDQIMAGLGYEALGDEPNILIGTHIFGKFTTGNQPSSMIARQGDSAYDIDKQSGVEHNGDFWEKSSLRGIEGFGSGGLIANMVLHSEDFDNVLWDDPSGNTTVTPNLNNSPRGAINVDNIAWTGIGLGLRQTIANLAPSTLYTLTIWGRNVSGNDTLGFTLAGGGPVDIQFDSVLVRRQIQITSGIGPMLLDISTAVSVGSFDLWGAQLVLGGSTSPYLRTTGTQYATLFSGMSLNSEIFNSNGINNLPDDAPFEIKHGPGSNDTQALLLLKNEGTNAAEPSVFITDRNPNGNIAPSNEGDIAIRSGSNPSMYQNKGGTIGDWKEVLTEDLVSEKVDFAVSSNTGALGVFGVYACTDTTAPRMLTISTSTIALGSPSNVHRFTVKDESENAGEGGFGIIVQTESGQMIDGNPVVSINRDSGALSFYVDGVTVFVEKEHTPPVAAVAFSGLQFDTSVQVDLPASIVFNNDGKKIFVMDLITDNVFEYILTIPYSMASGNVVYSGNSFNVNTQDNDATSIAFNPDGTKMYMMGLNSDAIHEYTLSIGFDLGSTVVSNGNSVSVGSEDSIPTTFEWSADGTKFFMLGVTNDTVFEYDAPTPFSVVGASYSGNSFSITSQETGPETLAFAVDGMRFFISGNTNNTVFQYDLTTPYSLASGVSYSGLSFSIASEIAVSRSMAFNPNGLKFFVIDAQNNNEEIFEYDMTPAFSLKGA